MEFYQVSFINCWIFKSKGDIFNCWPKEILSSFKFNCWVSYSKGNIYDCWTEETLSSFLPWNCYATNRFFLNYNCCCCCSTEDFTVVKTSIFKGLFSTYKTVLFFNSNAFYYFFASVLLPCSLFSTQNLFGNYCLELIVQSFDWTLQCNNFCRMCFLSF